MNTFFKITAGVLVSALLSLVISKQCKDFSVLLVLSACCMTVVMAMQYMEPIIALMQNLSDLANLDTGLLKILLKSAGIGILAEIVSLICVDSGNATLGKTLQISATVTILYLSVPLFTKLIELIEDILSAI